MTLRDLCEATTNDFLVKVTLANVVVAEFQRSTYESIVTTYLDATVSTVTFNASATGTRSMDVVLNAN